MKLKFFAFIIIFISISALTLFLYKWNTIRYDKNLTNSILIEELKNKIFNPAFLRLEKQKITTNFSLSEVKTDTINYNFIASINPKFPNILDMRLNSGDGFSGLNIDILKYNNYFYSSIKSYTDVVTDLDFLKSEKYKIVHQKLVLNKSNYKKGDSIFGKIELDIKDKPSNIIFKGKGYFRAKIE